MADLAGRPMAAWVLDALKPWTAEQVVITGSQTLPRALGLEARPDREPGLGPLGGLATGLEWAAEKGLGGVALLACDLPLLPDSLLGSILSRWPAGSDAVVPGSYGPKGCEPLCAGYSARCLPGIQELLDGGSRAMDLALTQCAAHVIPPEDLGSREALDRAFMNVNTQEDAALAISFLRSNRGDGIRKESADGGSGA